MSQKRSNSILLLALLATLLFSGGGGAAIIPGKPVDSPLLASIPYHKDFPEIPPKNRAPDQSLLQKSV